MPGLFEVQKILSAVVAEMACEPLEEWKQMQEASFDSVYPMWVGCTSVRRPIRTEKAELSLTLDLLSKCRLTRLSYKHAEVHQGIKYWSYC